MRHYNYLSTEKQKSLCSCIWVEGYWIFGSDIPGVLFVGQTAVINEISVTPWRKSRKFQSLWSTPWSQSHIATDGQSISKSWCRASFGAHDQIFITVWQLWSCFCGAPSLMRGRVCLLYILLVLASVVFLGSESLRSCDHILLSQIWDFPFRRLLRLAGSRWRYSNPPPHGWYIHVYIYIYMRRPELNSYSFYPCGSQPHWIKR
jgi:hypothetical protein